MAKSNAFVQSVKNVTVEGNEKVLILMSDGTTQMWVSQLYVDKLFKSHDLEGASNKALVGCAVSYDKITHKAGDVVKNKGVEVAGKTYAKDGYTIENFDIEELGEKAEAFQDAVDGHVAKAKAKAKLKGSMSKYFQKAAVTPDGELKQVPVEQIQQNEQLVTDASATAL